MPGRRTFEVFASEWPSRTNTTRESGGQITGEGGPASLRYGRSVDIVALDHVQVAAPPGCEADARRLYGELLGLVELVKPAALEPRT
jgi:hypothetical protein